MSANDRQEGGFHYKVEGIQCWDFVEAMGLGFLDGNVVKYVARWRKKNGVADLRKAAHYLDKLMEHVAHGTILRPQIRGSHRATHPLMVGGYIAAFARDNELPAPETAIITSVCTWSERAALIAARTKLEELMSQGVSGSSTSAPVP